jgi:DNA (cytosine-5)-methyltransferase 1
MGSEKYTLVDLFAGCGGIGLGFHQAGFETILANELHADPAKTYVQNLLNEYPEHMKIGSISDVLSNEKLQKMNLAPNEITCLAGGPPCQGFSMAGRGIANDPRNHLYREYLRVVAKLSPKSIVFENVPGFVNRYGLNLKKDLEKRLEKLGYETASGVLSAMDFGVPQLRKRFICIGVKKEIIQDRTLILPKATWTPHQISSQLTTKQVIGDLDVYHLRGGYGSGKEFGPDKYLKPARTAFQREMRTNTGTTSKDSTWNTLIPNHTKRVQKRMAAYLGGDTRQSLKGTSLETKKLSQRVLKENKPPKITIVSLPDDYIHYNSNMPRTLSVRECARLQTFPDDFKFYGKRTTGGLRRRIDVPQYTQVGNAIPPRLAKSIAMHLLSYISLNEDIR